MQILESKIKPLNDKKENKSITDLELDLLKKLEAEIKEVEGGKKTIKGYLQSQIDKVDRDNKGTRESLRLNGINYKKDKHGKYTDEIFHESGVVTSTEDAYAKTKTIVDRIKADAEAEYNIQTAKTKE